MYWMEVKKMVFANFVTEEAQSSCEAFETSSSASFMTFLQTRDDAGDN